MKMPCELVVWYTLPFIRRELAKELIEAHGFTQAKVARLFGVTDAAISQYMKEKRGMREELEGTEKYREFLYDLKMGQRMLGTDGIPDEVDDVGPGGDVLVDAAGGHSSQETGQAVRHISSSQLIR